MPELAEVAYYCSRWNPGIGNRVTAVELHGQTRCFRDADAEDVKAVLIGKRLIGSRTHGKRMLFEFSQGCWLGVHLGMTGRLLTRETSVALEKHDHLALKMNFGWLVFNDPRQFGKIELFESEGLPDRWRELQREILSKEFDYEYFDRILERRSRAIVKSLLLVQDLFPGVGNWMADEILWRARIRPDRRLGCLGEKEQKALFDSLRFVCRGAMKYVAPDYTDPPRSWLFRHRWKAGGVCPKMGKVLERDEVGGRTTCWSSSWQR